MVLRPRTAGILGASQVETQTESRPSMHSSLRALIALSLLACTSAVHMKIKVKNFTRWTYKVTQVSGNHNSGTGFDDNIANPGGQIEVTFEPKSGFLGVEKGVSGSFTLKGREVFNSIAVTFNFPAVGTDNFQAISSNGDIVEAIITYGGQNGANNEHNLEVVLATKPKAFSGQTKNAIESFFQKEWKSLAQAFIKAAGV